MQINNLIVQHEKGVSLVITFFTMTMIIVAVSGVGALLYKEVVTAGSIENSVPSIYAANTGIESVLYYDKKQAPAGAGHGICGVCDVCNDPSLDQNLRCASCQAVVLAINGCDVSRCDNCQITYGGSFDGKSYTVSTTVSPDPANPATSNLSIDARGVYENIVRHVMVNSK